MTAKEHYEIEPLSLTLLGHLLQGAMGYLGVTLTYAGPLDNEEGVGVQDSYAVLLDSEGQGDKGLG